MADDDISQRQESGSIPMSRDTVKLVTAATMVAALLVLSGLTLTGTVITLIIATPILVLFSPILVPAGAVMLVATAGFMLSGGLGVAAVCALAWIYKYVAGKQATGSEPLDYTRMRLAHKARELKDKYDQYVSQQNNNEAQGDVTQGQE